MTKQRPPTPLGYAVLGLLMMRAQSGYEIARAFATTPMAVYSSSPGAIYPAIKKLVGAGLVETIPRDGESTKTAFSVTKKGRSVFAGWLKKPVDKETVERGMAEFMLRFAFMSGNLPDADIKRLLLALKSEIEAHVAALEDYARQARPMMPPTGALALEAGIESYRAHARWAARAADALDAESSMKQRGGARKGSS